MTPSVALRLGRVSNLPTVATNAMAGMALAGAGMSGMALVLVVVAAALAYVAGMFLNDAFDAEIDEVSQPFRPIPSGAVGRGEVFAWGYGLLAIGVALFPVAGMLSGSVWQTAIAGLVLAGVIIAYNSNHKENPFGPILMGGCRVLVYAAAGLAMTGTPLPGLWLGALMLMVHVMGLTFVAKREGTGGIGRAWPFICIAVPPLYGLYLGLSEPLVLVFAALLAVADIIAVRLCLKSPKPDFGRAIPLLIAAIPLLDAVFIASRGLPGLALVAALCCPLTLVLQKWVRGT